MSIELGEEFLNRDHTQGEHERLVPIISGAKIATAEHLGQGYLGHFLSGTEDAKFRLAAQRFAPADQADLPAQVSDPVIPENFLSLRCRRLRINLVYYLSHIRHQFVSLSLL